MVPIIITGAAGRMGKMLIERSLAFKDIKLVGATERPGSPALNQDIGIVAGVPPLKKAVLDHIYPLPPSLQKERPVVIDFTQPDATLMTLEQVLKCDLPMVIGTTGFSEAQKKEIEKASKKIPIVASPNMSVGVNLMFQLAGDAARVLGDAYDIEILEAHHRLKKDAPSGTAVRLAEILAESTGRKYPADFNFHREGMMGERPRREIGMQVIRGGDIVGEHTVFYCGEGERVEIRHVAASRATFADGALRAAIWVSERKPGYYSMKDVLGMKGS